MRGLALDQSLSSCGWALYDQGRVTSGAWPLCEGVARRAWGFNELRAKLSKIQAETPLDWLAFEAPLKTRIDNLPKLRGLLGLTGTIESWAVFRDIPLHEIDQRNWRTTWLQDARKGVDREQLKHLAIARAQQFGFKARTSDEAEALAILDHTLHLLKIQPQWRTDSPLLATI